MARVRHFPILLALLALARAQSFVALTTNSDPDDTVSAPPIDRCRSGAIAARSTPTLA
jgi:hypothetical protein